MPTAANPVNENDSELYVKLAKKVNPANEEVGEWKDAILKKLQKKVTFDLSETAFEDVMAFFCQSTAINMIIDPKLQTQILTRISHQLCVVERSEQDKCRMKIGFLENEKFLKPNRQIDL